MRHLAKGAVVAAALTVVSAAAQADGDPEAGKQVFKKCHACHNVGEDARNSVGPVLNGVVGRKSGTYPDYNYSDANKNSGLIWDAATLQKYLRHPQEVVPHTKMMFPGLGKDKEVDDVIAYLSTIGPDGKTK